VLERENSKAANQLKKHHHTEASAQHKPLPFFPVAGRTAHLNNRKMLVKVLKESLRWD
jgi:hypothetical protein